MSRVWVGLAVTGGLLLGGCDTNNGPACGTFVACGGDVIGTWSIGRACPESAVDDAVNSEDILPDCPQAQAVTNVAPSGSITFGADGRYSSTVTVGGSVTMSFPASCAAQGGRTPTCAEIDQQLQTLVAEPDSPFASGGCSGSSTCTCTFNLASETDTENGTYTAANNILTTNLTTGGTDTESYCVEGNTLKLGTPTDFGLLTR